MSEDLPTRLYERLLGKNASVMINSLCSFFEEVDVIGISPTNKMLFDYLSSLAATCLLRRLYPRNFFSVPNNR
jgi:hypothetical protein